MLKKIGQKNKRARFFISITVLFILASLIAYIVYPYMSIYLILNTFPFLSSTNNSTSTFYGENIDMSQVLPTSRYYVVNSKGKDLIDIAADLGINIVRITNAQQSFDHSNDSFYSRDQWNQVLNKMQSKGMKALILIEANGNNHDYSTPDIQPAYLDLVQQYIDSGVFSHPNVYAVDIKNEPVLTDANISMLKAVHTMIKAKYPYLKQTIGWWASTLSSKDPYNPGNYNWLDFSAGQKVESIVDFYSVHMYALDTNKFGINVGPDQRTKVFLSQVQNGLHTKKPILIEEFGEANGDAVSDQDTIGSPELQASVYQGVYQALKEMHSNQILGAIAFDFYSRNHYPDAWAILKNKGDYLFPAACVLQRYAALEKNKSSCQAATDVTSQSYLFENNDNHTHKSVHLSDRIGLKLKLDRSKNYSLFLNMNGLLRLVELFEYNPASDSYHAVYQATSEGTIQLTIMPDAGCMVGNDCTTSVYALTITIQK